MHNKTKTSTELPQTMGSTVNNRSTTRRIFWSKGLQTSKNDLSDTVVLMSHSIIIKLNNLMRLGTVNSEIFARALFLRSFVK